MIFYMDVIIHSITNLVILVEPKIYFAILV